MTAPEPEAWGPGAPIRNGKLDPWRAVLVLRACGYELEATVLEGPGRHWGDELTRLSTHLALVCDLLADHLELPHARPEAPPGPAPG